MQKMTSNQRFGLMVAVLWIGLVLIGVTGAWQNRTLMIAERQAQLKSLDDAASSVVDHY
jgi:methyl-accepting chemotaxis protein